MIRKGLKHFPLSSNRDKRNGIINQIPLIMEVIKMKVIFRGDDVAYTDVHNIGTWRAIDEGVMSHADLMLDGFGIEDAYDFLNKRPWVSVGWHTHFWCKPILPPEEVPSLVDETGRFKFRRINCMEHEVEDVNYDEMVKECFAEVDYCKKRLGRYPDTCNDVQTDNVKGRAVKEVCDTLGIPYGFEGGPGPHDSYKEPLDQYKELHITEYFTSGKHPATPKLRVALFDNYDPAAAIIDMPIDENIIYERSLHPGYLDGLVLEEQHCTIHRVKDVSAYCDKRVFDWVKDNKIKIINRKDALYGTDEYQQHLKEIGSPLYIG